MTPRCPCTPAGQLLALDSAHCALKMHLGGRERQRHPLVFYWIVLTQHFEKLQTALLPIWGPEGYSMLQRMQRQVSM